MNWCQDFKKIRVHQEREEEDAPLSLGFVTGIDAVFTLPSATSLRRICKTLSGCAAWGRAVRFCVLQLLQIPDRHLLATLGIPGKVVRWTSAKPACRNKGLSTAPLLIG